MYYMQAARKYLRWRVAGKHGKCRASDPGKELDGGRRALPGKFGDARLRMWLGLEDGCEACNARTRGPN